MIELILGTYGVACWLILVKFKLVKINSYSIFTAILGGVVLLVGILMLLSISIQGRCGDHCQKFSPAI